MVTISKEIKKVRKPKVYTFEEYLRREEKAVEKHEFYNGKIVRKPSVNVYRNQTYDRLGKVELYKQLPSFQEYVLVNANKYAVETRFQEEPNLWRIRNEYNIDNSVTLHALGTSISMADIYENIVFPLKKDKY